MVLEVKKSKPVKSFTQNTYLKHVEFSRLDEFQVFRNKSHGFSLDRCHGNKHLTQSLPW